MKKSFVIVPEEKQYGVYALENGKHQEFLCLCPQRHLAEFLIKRLTLSERFLDTANEYLTGRIHNE